MEKPKKPIEPNIQDRSKYPITGKPVSEDSPYVRDYRKYQKEKAKYDIDIEIYEQLKLIKFVKVAKERLILEKYKIVKIK